jgi:hypothetical protein
MKRILVIIFLFASSLAFTQNNMQDIIFSIDGKIIKNCSIVKVAPDRVRYAQSEKLYEIDAKAYVKKGVFFSLEAERQFYKTQLKQLPDSIKEYTYGKTNYEKLYKTHHRATVMRNFGIGMTAGGLISVSYGVYLMRSDEVHPDSKGISGRELSGLGLVFLGVVSSSTGVPFLLIGEIQRNRTRKRMKSCIQENATLTAGLTSNGFGLTFKF